MPLYDFRCETCEAVQEIAAKIAEKPDTVPCQCGGVARQMVTIGGIEGDEPAWLQHEHVQGQIRSPYDRPIENRTQYKRHLAERGIAEMR